MKKNLFIDLDGTLTPSRSLISGEMAQALDDFIVAPIVASKDITLEKNNIVIVSGASREQIKKQTNGVDVICSVLAQNGNDSYGRGGHLLWRNELNWMQKHDALFWIWEILHNLKIPREKWPDLVEDRGCQISFSVLGHNAPLQEKMEYDPKGEKRREILLAFPFIPLSNSNLEVRIGGTTCFDFYEGGKNKGSNVLRLIEMMQWNKEECLYVGDALYKGGNDESVMGLIDCISVASPDETLMLLKQYANA